MSSPLALGLPAVVVHAVTDDMESRRREPVALLESGELVEVLPAFAEQRVDVPGEHRKVEVELRSATFELLALAAGHRATELVVDALDLRAEMAQSIPELCRLRSDHRRVVTQLRDLLADLGWHT